MSDRAHAEVAARSGAVFATFSAWAKSGAPGGAPVSSALRGQLERRGDPIPTWIRLCHDLTELGTQAESAVIADASKTQVRTARDETMDFLLLAALWAQLETLKPRAERRVWLQWLFVDRGEELLRDFERAIAEAR